MPLPVSVRIMVHPAALGTATWAAGFWSAVEATNRTHITERLKMSGMRWGITGGQAVLTFRSLVKSGRFDSAWDRIMGARGRNGAANDNRNQIHQPLAA